MTLSTRLATQKDIPELLALWQRFMREESDAVPEADPCAALRNWTERLHSQVQKHQAVLVESHGIPVGFAGFIDSSDRSWIPQSVAYVVDLYIVPEARASCAAKLLFGYLINDAAEGYEEVWTNTSAQNKRVQVLLKRVGFIPLGGFEISGLKEQLYFKKDRKKLLLQRSS